jgi:predicted transcriptional regulator
MELSNNLIEKLIYKDNLSLKWENRIGDILVNEGYISKEDLYKALSIQKRGGEGWPGYY